MLDSRFPSSFIILISVAICFIARLSVDIFATWYGICRSAMLFISPCPNVSFCNFSNASCIFLFKLSTSYAVCCPVFLFVYSSWDVFRVHNCGTVIVFTPVFIFSFLTGLLLHVTCTVSGFFGH